MVKTAVQEPITCVQDSIYHMLGICDVQQSGLVLLPF